MEIATRSGFDRGSSDPLRASARSRSVVASAAVIGGAAVVTGAALPWLSIFSGLDSYSGTLALNGRLLAAGGGMAIVLGLWYGVRGSSRLRYAIGTLGFGLALFSAYLLAQLLLVYHSLKGIFLPALGPGVFVATAGALAIMATLLVGETAKEKERSSGRLDARTATLIALSAGAGTIHLAVASDHFHEWLLLGVFFVALGVAQIGWAGLLAILGPARVLLIAATANAAVVVLWIFSRTTGLPIGPDPGVAEAVGFPDVTATVFEVALAGLAVWSLRRPQHAPNRTLTSLGWLLPLAVAPAAVAAVVSAVGAAG